jgi:putative membrane protein
MMGKTLLSLGFAVAMLTAASAAPAADKNTEKFIKDAIQGDMAEVQVGKLVQEKSMDDGARAFGDMLVKDHSEHLDKATSLANSIGVTPPSEPSKQQKAMYNKLSKLSGKAFDREFAKAMVEDHKKDIKEFEKETKNPNEQVAQFAKDTLPTLHKHLETAQSLEKAETASK